jgi:hypothetical protein
VKRPKPGDCVIVWWLDSGSGVRDFPVKQRPGALCVKETHGRVISLDPDPSLKLPKSMSSDTLLLRLCSAGNTDGNSELGAVWWPSVVRIDNFGGIEPWMEEEEG